MTLTKKKQKLKLKAIEKEIGRAHVKPANPHSAQINEGRIFNSKKKKNEGRISRVSFKKFRINFFLLIFVISYMSF